MVANPKILSVLNAFASGVFLAMALIHIQPESVNDYTKARKAGCPGYTSDGRRMLRELDDGNSTAVLTPEFLEFCSNDLFPMPYLLFFVGYLIILTVDRVILRHSHGDLLEEHSHSHGSSSEKHK